MVFKTKLCNIEIEIMLILTILTSIISKTTFKFLYYFFACYLFILFHELMHILVGSLLDKKLIKVKFSIAGTCAVFEKENYIKDKGIFFKNIFIYLSGPVSNIILTFTFYDNIMIREINMFLAVVNLLPIYPLDGYNILLNSLKLIINEKNADIIIDKIGNMVIILIVAISIYQIMEFKKITITIFCIYLFLLKITKKSI